MWPHSMCCQLYIHICWHTPSGVQPSKQDCNKLKLSTANLCNTTPWHTATYLQHTATPRVNTLQHTATPRRDAWRAYHSSRHYVMMPYPGSAVPLSHEATHLHGWQTHYSCDMTHNLCVMPHYLCDMFHHLCDMPYEKAYASLSLDATRFLQNLL